MSEPDPSSRAKALTIHDRLARVFGAPLPYFQTLGPLDELVSTFLNHRTRNRDAKAAFRALKGAYPDWADLTRAPTEEVERLIAPVTWPERKAPGVKALLRAVAARRGALELDFLGGLPVAEARAWLEALPGVGPKTSAAVLSFSTLRGRALPVDSHHHRVAQRVGLIPGDMAVGPSHAALEALLPAEWDAQAVYDHHQLLMRHGQKVCHFHRPDCTGCALLDLCPTGLGLPRPASAAEAPRPAQGELPL